MENALDFKYNSKHCITSMMSRYSKLLSHEKGYHKNKNEAVLFDSSLTADYKKVSYHYIYTKPDFKPNSMYKLTQVVSPIDQELINLDGKKWREIRETRNKWVDLNIREHTTQEELMALIDAWDKTQGQKYGFHRRSGQDRNFFKHWYDPDDPDLYGRFFYWKGDLVGYSVLSWNGNNWDYLVRKYKPISRNLCLAIDYFSFWESYFLEGASYVNWGASGKGVLGYKKKFGVVDSKEVYFYKVEK